MSVLLPLYVYPQAGAWDPLYSAAKTYPEVDFAVIINPCSGPCDSKLPSSLYLNEIPKLRTYHNIRTLGYVATNYTEKAISEVLKEIETYANWPKYSNNTKLSVNGIFFDETPNQYESSKYDYLKRAAQSVKNGTKFKDHLVVHNPGNIPLISLTSSTSSSPNYMNLADITVVFEDAFEKWIDSDNFDALQDLPLRNSKTAVLLHSVPNIGKSVMSWVTEQLSNTADWVFLTSEKTKDASGEYYGNFSPLFDGLVRALAS